MPKAQQFRQNVSPSWHLENRIKDLLAIVKGGYSEKDTQDAIAQALDRAGIYYQREIGLLLPAENILMKRHIQVCWMNGWYYKTIVDFIIDGYAVEVKPTSKEKLTYADNLQLAEYLFCVGIKGVYLIAYDDNGTLTIEQIKARSFSFDKKLMGHYVFEAPHV